MEGPERMKEMEDRSIENNSATERMFRLSSSGVGTRVEEEERFARP